MANNAMLIADNLNNLKGLRINSFSSIKNYTVSEQFPEHQNLADEFLREFYIKNQNIDIIHIHSYFDSPVYKGVASVKKYFDTPTVVTLYDIIPLILPKLYLPNNALYSEYTQKLNEILRADAVVCISERTKQAYLKHFGDTGQIVENISIDASDFFKKMEIEEKEWKELKEKIAVDREFIFCLSGDDKRKNNEFLIEAFAEAIKDKDKNIQLVLSFKMSKEIEKKLLKLIANVGLTKNDIILTNYLSDEDVRILYNKAKAFVFPSLEEGFGLPVLEAMRCECPVIGSDNSSISEIIIDKRFMFSPVEKTSLTEKINLVLTDEDYLLACRNNSIKNQKLFSWQRTANACKEVYKKVLANKKPQAAISNSGKKRLAWVSPFPPDKSGIAYYSEDLLPALSKHFDVEVFADIAHSEGNQQYFVKPLESLKTEYKNFDRVIYNVGNSHFHEKYYEMIKGYTGVVILHDLFLIGLMGCVNSLYQKEFYLQEFLNAHGNKPLMQFFKTEDWSILTKYPASKWVFDNSIGVISHSNFLKESASEFFTIDDSKVAVIAQPIRSKPLLEKKKTSREVILSSFGDVVKGKNILRIVQSLRYVKPPKDSDLIYNIAGATPDSDYLEKIKKSITKIKCPNIKVNLLGRLDDEEYNKLITETDIAIQLRGRSRGETSRALLECMSYGVATIANTGTGQEFSSKDVIYDIKELKVKNVAAAIKEMISKPELRNKISKAAQAYISKIHSPFVAAENIKKITDKFYSNYIFNFENNSQIKNLYSEIAKKTSPEFKAAFAKTLNENVNRAKEKRRVFIDVSILENTDYKSGIQRVVKKVITNLFGLQNNEAEYVLVCRSQDGYVTAKGAYNNIFGFAYPVYHKDIEPADQDVFLMLDFDPWLGENNVKWLEYHKNRGMKILPLVYDTLPIKNKEWFDDAAYNYYVFWFTNIMPLADKIFVISDSVGKSVKYFLNFFDIKTSAEVCTIKMGADAFEKEYRKLNRAANSNEKNFLMVGTVEPRKGYKFIVECFRELWDKGSKHNLTIIGKPGWGQPELIELLKDTKFNYKKHFEWLDTADDNDLLKIINSSDALIANSFDEGFGLPLIETAYLGLPVIARNTEVYQEVAGRYATYFFADNKISFTECINGNIKLITEPDKLFTTWQESSAELDKIICNL